MIPSVKMSVFGCTQSTLLTLTADLESRRVEPQNTGLKVLHVLHFQMALIHIRIGTFKLSDKFFDVYYLLVNCYTGIDWFFKSPAVIKKFFKTIITIEKWFSIPPICFLCILIIHFFARQILLFLFTKNIRHIFNCSKKKWRFRVKIWHFEDWIINVCKLWIIANRTIHWHWLQEKRVNTQNIVGDSLLEKSRKLCLSDKIGGGWIHFI